MPYLLDTNVAIHLRDGDEAIQTRFEALDDRAFLSVLSRVELEGGIYAVPALTDARRRAVKVILSLIETIEFDDAAATTYGAIIARIGFSRRKVVDRMIAATALEQGLTMITCNAADFRDVPGLDLVVW